MSAPLKRVSPKLKHVLSEMERVLFVTVAIFALAVSAGCQRRPPIGERLLSCLEEARAWQHRADIHLADGAVNQAISDVEEVLRIPFPDGAPEAEEARLDAHARLAKLFLGSADEKRALEQVALGRRE